MLILHNSGKDKKNPGLCIAAIFGVGLIGTYLIRNLYQEGYQKAQFQPFCWQLQQNRKNQKTDILHYIQNLVGVDHDYRKGLYSLPNRATVNPAPMSRIDFVWSAGKGGFTMEERDTRAELDAFSEVVEMAITVLKTNPSSTVRFHMISSAGGLYEGQRNVGTASRPAPKRPYGVLKLAQEKILHNDCGLIRFIYRPTSVYGFAGQNRRMGLIPTLLWNGAKNKVSTIFGAPETLRDYVWADDLGAFIAGMVASKISSPGRFILASGKPSTLFEIFIRIEKVLNKKLFCHYTKSGGNVDHCTFAPGTLPTAWNPLNLETGIRKTHNFMFSNIDNTHHKIWGNNILIQHGTGDAPVE